MLPGDSIPECNRGDGTTEPGVGILRVNFKGYN
jgi:hypothetical protein